MHDPDAASPGAISFSSSRRLAESSGNSNVMPVRLLPGRARLTATPARTGSPGVTKTIGNSFAADLTNFVNSVPRTKGQARAPGTQGIGCAKRPCGIGTPDPVLDDGRHLGTCAGGLKSLSQARQQVRVARFLVRRDETDDHRRGERWSVPQAVVRCPSELDVRAGAGRMGRATCWPTTSALRKWSLPPKTRADPSDSR
jgi:hypothetical protein